MENGKQLLQLIPMRSSRTWGACSICDKHITHGQMMVVNDGILQHHKCYLWRQNVEQTQYDSKGKSSE